MTPKTPQEELVRAGQAKEIIESALFKEMRERIESTMAAQRRVVPLKETEMHTRLIIMEQLWGNLIDFFEQTAQTGRMAELQIAQERSFKQRVFGR